jgi:hypothetical protein
MRCNGPLLFSDVRGKLGGVVFSYWKGQPTGRRLVTPNNPNTAEQQAVRGVVYDASIAWKLGSTVGATEIDAEYKTAYDAVAMGQKLSGFNLFIKDCMAINLVDTVGVKSYDGTLAIAVAPGVLA